MISNPDRLGYRGKKSYDYDITDTKEREGRSEILRIRWILLKYGPGL